MQRGGLAVFRIKLAAGLVLCSAAASSILSVDSKPESNELPPVAPPIRRVDELPPTQAPDRPEMSSTRIRIRSEANDSRSANPTYGRYETPYQSGRAEQTVVNGASRHDREGNSTALTQVELKRLSERDVVLIIDQSSSMLTHDCPGSGLGGTGAGRFGGLLSMPLGGAISRWQWCTAQTNDLSKQTSQIFNQGITVVMFSSGFQVFQRVTLRQVPDLFARNRPMGGTNLAPALGSQIGAYFKRRAESRGNVKPLVIGIVTDGCPNNRQSVKQAIIEATHMMRHPQEITIVFFLIGGMDYQGERFVEGLENNLTRAGAAFPIVRGIRFDELRQIGLTRALANSLQ